jgi:adenylate cyclase class IV
MGKKEQKQKQFEYEYRYPAGSFDEREIMRLAREVLPTARVRWALLVNHIYRMPGYSDVMLRVRDVHYRGRPARSLLTLKLPPDAKGGFEQEYETWVDDGEAARRIVATLGLEKRHVMEKIRGTVQLPALDGEIAFDLNPGLPAAMEIEAGSKKALGRMVRALGLGGPPTKAMRAESSLEGQYEARYGVDGKALRARFRGEGRSLLFSDSAPVRELVRGGKRVREFDRVFARQARKAAMLRRGRLV